MRLKNALLAISGILLISPRPIELGTDGGNNAQKIAKGFINKAEASLVSTGDALLHPVKTAKKLIFAAKHPIETIESAAKNMKCKGDKFECLGGAGFTVVSFFSGGALANTGDALVSAAVNIGTTVPTLADMSSQAEKEMLENLQL